MTELLTTGAVAGMLGVSRERVLALVKEGRLRPVATDSYGRRYFTVQDAQELRAQLEKARGPRTRAGQ